MLDFETKEALQGVKSAREKYLGIVAFDDVEVFPRPPLSIQDIL